MKATKATKLRQKGAEARRNNITSDNSTRKTFWKAAAIAISPDYHPPDLELTFAEIQGLTR